MTQQHDLHDCRALANAALLHEGVAEYFPGLDPASFDAVSTLAQHMLDNPDAWSHEGPDHSWKNEFQPHLLALYALTCGAEPIA